ncbi:MAG: diguanylate cyclase [Spirochaetales bacterium]|nr:diguanylate cyclase [Spirochaetales bacterium]
MNTYNLDLENKHVLIIDDDPTNIQVAAAHLKALTVQISYALSAAEGFERIERKSPHLILLDIMMPEVDGITFCRQLKEKREYRDIPVVFLTARVDKATIVQAFEAGGVDYLTKPFHGPELNQRVLNQLRLIDLVQRFEMANAELNLQILKAMEAQDTLEQYQADLLAVNSQLKDLASKDSLTGLLNRRRGWELLEYEAARSDRSKQKTGLILIDIDHFKQVNDIFGHPEGDRILVEVSTLIQEGIRAQDFCIRWGGEEFLIILPETDLEGSMILAEKIAGQSRNRDWKLPDRGITFSGGCVIREPFGNLDEAVSLADELLYHAKRGGRNQILVSSKKEEVL